MDKTTPNLGMRATGALSATKTIRAIIAAAFAAAMAIMCVGCACASSAANPVALSGEGVSVTESDIADQVNALKTQIEADGQMTWNEYLEETGQTAAQMREAYAWTLADTQLVLKHASELGVHVDQKEVEELFKATKDGFETDEAWKEFLAQSGMTEEMFRLNIEKSLADERLIARFSESAEVTGEDIEAVMNPYLESYAGEVRFERIRFMETTLDGTPVAGDPAEIAAQALAAIESGKVSFDAAYEQYAGQGATEIVPGGEWSMYAGLDESELATLRSLEVGQTAVIERDVYADAVRVTAKVPNANDVAGFGDLPEAVQEEVLFNAKNNVAWTGYSKWVDGLRQAANIVLAPAPEGLSY